MLIIIYQNCYGFEIISVLFVDFFECQKFKKDRRLLLGRRFPKMTFLQFGFALKRFNLFLEVIHEGLRGIDGTLFKEISKFS